MKHTLQPLVQFIPPDEIIHDFGLEQAKKVLAMSADKDFAKEAMLEQENPRLLYCADSLNGDLCKGSRIVLSTSGVSLGINTREQFGLLTKTQTNFDIFNNFLNRTIVWYVKFNAYIIWSNGPVHMYNI